MILNDVKQQRELEMIDRFFDKWGKFPYPKCYKCQKDVDRFEVFADPEKNTISFRVYCHDEREEARMPFDKVMHIDQEKYDIAINYAFYKQSTIIQGERIIYPI